MNRYKYVFRKLNMQAARLAAESLKYNYVIKGDRFILYTEFRKDLFYFGNNYNEYVTRINSSEQNETPGQNEKQQK